MMNDAVTSIEPGLLDIADVPVPTGWRIVVQPRKVEEKSAGGIVMPDSVQDANKHLAYVGQVLLMGDLCYTDARYAIGERDPKPWCSVGDWVMFGQYEGQKIKVKATDNSEIELIVLNDDQIKAIVPNPVRVRAYI